MGQRIGLIIFLAIVGIQVVAGIIQKAAKQQNKQREKQLRKPPGRPGPSQTSVSVERPVARPGRDPGVVGSSRLEDLAARRKAQLEELRRRRTQRPASPQRGVRPTARPSVAQPAPPAAARRSDRIEVVKADHRAIREAEEAHLRRRQRERQREQELEAQSAAAEERERVRRLEEARRRRAAEEAQTRPDVEVGDAYDASRGALGARTRRLAEMLHQRSTLQDLFILKELLEPPVSIRSMEGIR